MRDDKIVIYADGAAKGNPGPGGWGAVILCADTVTELGGRAAHTTNNRMELTAAIRALEHIRDQVGSVLLFTDSSYLVQGITGWIKNWRRRGWKTAEGGEVLNRELWEALWTLVQARGERSIEWRHVRGHAGIPGNERADQIASSQALDEPVALYVGPRAGHDMDWDAPVSASTPKAATSRPTARASGGKPYSYLSLVGGQVVRHASWAECERRVRGVSGARFKKATSAADEEAILKSWGLPPSALKP